MRHWIVLTPQRYTRHHVKGEDYPALIDGNQGAALRNQAAAKAQSSLEPQSQDGSRPGSDSGSRAEGGWELVDQQHDQGASDRSSQGNCRGTLVHGLTYNDILALDIFEGTVSALPLFLFSMLFERERGS